MVERFPQGPSTFESGVRPQESSDSLNPWNVKPFIEGFSAEESGQIYDGNFQSTLERFRAVDNKQRDAEILRLLPELGHTVALLVNQLDIAIDEWNNQTYAKECSKSLKNLNAFYTQLLELYQGEE